jgi:hypothetical protein
MVKLILLKHVMTVILLTVTVVTLYVLSNRAFTVKELLQNAKRQFVVMELFQVLKNAMTIIQLMVMDVLLNA